MSQAQIQVIKSRIKLQDLVREDVELKSEAGGRRLVGRCPFHEENTGSFNVNVDDQFFKCFGCGKSGDVYSWLAWKKFRRLEVEGEEFQRVLEEAAILANVKLEKQKPSAEDCEVEVLDEPDEPEPEPKREILPSLDAVRQRYARTGKITNEFFYTNPATKQPELIVLRIENESGKTFRQLHPVEGGFVAARPKGKLPLYNRARMQNSQTVVVCEGEKCVHIFNEFKFIATTSPMGAGKAKEADWSVLAGKKVILWPDADDIGKSHMRDVKEILERLQPATTILIVNVDSLNICAKGDIAEYVEPYREKAKPEDIRDFIQVALDTAQPQDEATELQERLEDTISGKRVAVPWPWPILSAKTQALLPGTITILGGGAGNAKSFFVVQALMSWIEQQVKTALFVLEEDRAYFQSRALAMLEANGSFLDLAWARENSTAIRTALEKHRETLKTIGKHMWDAPEKAVTLKEMLVWIEERCKDGYRNLIVDPVTAMQPSQKPWIDDHELILNGKTLMRKYGASLILVTHPSKGGGGKRGFKSPDDMAGGKAYRDFTQTVLWLEFTEKNVDVQTRAGVVGYDINRSVQLWKTRNGTGQGAALAYKFDPATLLFTEYGIIVPKNKKR